MLSLTTNAISLNDDTVSPFKWVSSLGFSFGGAEATEVRYDRNDDEIEAGGPLYMGIGGDYRLNSSAFSLQGMIASQFDSADADNGDASLMDRTALDILAFYDTGPHRLGMGLTRHISPKFHAEDTTNTHFKNSTGLLFEYNYRYTTSTAFGLRYTDIDYSPAKNINQSTVTGDNLGFFIKSFF